jgi:site-specific recombinase XerD
MVTSRRTRHNVAPDSLEPDELLEELARYERKSLPQNTRRAYAADWADFRRWCERRRLVAMPARPDTVALYLVARAKTHKVSSLSRRLTVISKLHKAWGKPNPIQEERVRRVWRGILRDKGEAVSRKKPTLIADLRKMMEALPQSLSGSRDRAVILLGFAGALRRSELVALDLSDLELTKDGFIVRVRRSKTDQTARGRKIGIPYGEHEQTCPVSSVLKWINESGIDDGGALFRKVNRHGDIEGDRLTDRSVALIVKRAAKLAGINPKCFAGHSLRAGLATAAAIAGVDERAIQQQTGHKSLKVLRTYIREGSLFRNNAARKVGL